MTTRNKSGGLSDAESADLTERVERFRALWSPDGSTDLAASLPPTDAPHRRAVLVRLIQTDMERRGATGLPFRVERYINQFPAELTSGTVPAELLLAEYRLRHRYTDKPKLSDYQRWFPDQYPAMKAELDREPLSMPTRRTPVESINFGAPHTLVDNAPTPMATPPPDVLPSDTPYRLMRKLGSGAFGEVYEARAPGEIPVAVKRIMRPVDDPASRAEEEALEAIKRLSHPFLLKTNAYWILNDRLVIVMELAEGSLADRLEDHQRQGRQGIPVEDLIPLFEQAGEALDYLHAEKVSHRDIKPENILLLKGYAKVADFGLARMQKSILTVVGSTAGTPAYMAPEMWQEKVSIHSDQYSLAATYVRVRLGRMLFAANFLVDLGLAHRNDIPDLNPLPPAEQAVLHRALAKKPEHRFGSCLEFAKALRAAVFPPPEPQKVRERRTAAILTTVGVACAVALAVTLATLYLLRPPDDQRTADPGANGKEEKQDKPPELPLVAIPVGWTADLTTTETIGGKRYPGRLTRKVGEDTLVAILLPAGDSGVPTHWMLENKITNRVFSTVWKELEDDKNSELYRFADGPGSALAPGEWKRGARDYAYKSEDPEDPKNWIGLEGDQAEVPVSGVTVPEAILVARKLGGALPGFRQWLKATGAYETSVDPPAGKRLAEKLTFEERRKEFDTRDLALGRDRPFPVSRGKDISYRGIRQLVSNGREWLGQENPENDATRIALPTGEMISAAFVGQGYNDTVVMDFKAILGYSNKKTQLITQVKGHYAGFRIVLTPP